MFSEDYSLWIMALLYIAAGVNHFMMPRFYLRIIPPYLPFPSLINQASGLAEIALGVLLLFSTYTSIAAWGIIALLVLVFPANLYHAKKDWHKKRIRWILVLRLPLQALLIGWAYSYV